MPATGFSPIQLFHSSTSGTLPTTSQLFTGEIFWNIADNKVYGLNTGGTALQTIVGSLGNQNANTVAITGGSINGTSIGGKTPSTGDFTSVLSPIVGAGTGSNLSLQANATTWATLFQSGGLSLGNTTDPGLGNLSVSGSLIVNTSSTNAAKVMATTTDSGGRTFAFRGKNSSTTDLFSVRSDGYFQTGLASASPYNLTSANAANVYVGSDGALYRSTSSLKYKTNVKDATYGLKEVLKLRPVTYQGLSEKEKNKTFGGLIAEEVDALGLTEFVVYAEDGTPDALAYSNMVSLLIKAIQELNFKFDSYFLSHSQE